MHFVVFNTNRAGMEQARLDKVDALGAYIQDHADHPNVTVRFAGPTLDKDGEAVNGSLLIIEAPSLDAARAFVADSPFGKANLFADSQLRPWNWIVGRPA